MEEVIKLIGISSWLLLIGLIIGISLEAHLWRKKGKHEYMNTKESGGNLYSVRRETKNFQRLAVNLTAMGFFQISNQKNLDPHAKDLRHFVASNYHQHHPNLDPASIPEVIARIFASSIFKRG